MLDTSLIRDSGLLPVAHKVLQKEPVSTDEALYMLSADDIVGLGAIANHVRESINGNRAFYGVNMNLNYTNICELRCPLCAFSRDAGDADA